MTYKKVISPEGQKNSRPPTKTEAEAVALVREDKKHLFKASLHAFSLVEILAVIVILAVLAAILLPIASAAINRGNQAKCVSNLRQISVASASYSADNNGAWPPSGVSGPSFAEALFQYIGRVPTTTNGSFMRSPFVCPSAQTEQPNGSYRFRGVYVLPSANALVNGRYGLSYGHNTYASLSASSAGTRVPNRLSVEK